MFVFFLSISKHISFVIMFKKWMVIHYLVVLHFGFETFRPAPDCLNVTY